MEVMFQKFRVFLYMVAQFYHIVFWKEYSFFIKLLMYLCCKSIVCINTHRSLFFLIDFCVSVAVNTHSLEDWLKQQLFEIKHHMFYSFILVF